MSFYKKKNIQKDPWALNLNNLQRNTMYYVVNTKSIMINISVPAYDQQMRHAT